MKQKYFIPYVCITIPIVGIVTALLFLIGRTENHTAIGLAYLSLFARRNETVYRQKRNYRNENLPLKPFLRKYLPAFLWGDLIAATFTLALVAIVVQAVALGSYLHIFYIYEQEKYTTN